MKQVFGLIILVVLSVTLYSQTGYKVIRTKLPFSKAEKDYYVKQVGNKYVLNGDIIVGNAGQSLMLYQSNNHHDGSYIWPRGYVPVKIDGSMKGKKTNQQADMYENALKAIKEINDKTNIRLVPYTSQKDYIRIMYTSETGYGGISPLGRKGGEQILYITRESGVGTIIHELLHSLGFWHEQSRHDRDLYVEIDTTNVMPEQRYNFQIEPGTPTSGYDYNSIMHYKADAFAIDKNKPTIRCKNGGKPYDCGLGSENLSAGDITGINTSYAFNKDVAKRDYAAELPFDYRQQSVKRVVDKPLENGIYRIKILGSSKESEAPKYLDITGVSNESGALLQQWDNSGLDNQKFAIIGLNNGLYLIKAVHSNKYINVTGESTAFRATISQADLLDKDNFKFYIRYENSRDGYSGYTIQGLQSAMYWTVLGLKNGEHIVQEPVLKEYFEFERVANLPSLYESEKMKTTAPVRKLNTIKKQ